jgi:hypothetical protein
LKKQKQPTRRKVTIIMDSDAAEEYREANQEWGMAQLMFPETSEDPRPEKAQQEFNRVKARYEAAREEAERASITFKFQSIGRSAFKAMLDEYPPTDEQVAKAEKDGDQYDWDPETFPAALVAAASYEPNLTEENVREMWDSPDWSGAELNDLFVAALQCQNTSRLLEVGNG